jgi:hypothetical protein
VFASISAINARGALGSKAAAAAPAIKALPDQGASPDGRFNSYVPRLLADLTAALGGEGGAREKAPAKKGKKKAQ